MHNLSSGPGGEGLDLADITLEIKQPPMGVPPVAPVTIRNLAADILTVQSTQPISSLQVGDLKGQEAILRLPGQAQEEGPEYLEVRGVVSWAKQSTNGQRLLWLGMEFPKLSPELRRALEDRIAHTPRDMRALWQRWDELKAAESRVLPFLTGRGLTYLAAGMAAGGLACQVLPPLAVYRSWGLLVMVGAGFVGLIRVFTGRFPKRFELP